MKPAGNDSALYMTEGCSYQLDAIRLLEAKPSDNASKKLRKY